MQLQNEIRGLRYGYGGKSVCGKAPPLVERMCHLTSTEATANNHRFFDSLRFAEDDTFRTEL